MSTGITLVIPNWNGADRLERLFESVHRQTIQVDKVLVVDNGSSDNSKLVAKAAGVEILALDRNYGFARAVNAGIAESRTEAVAIVNNDVRLRPDCLERLHSALGTYAFAVPKIVWAEDENRIDGTFDLTSRGFCSWRAGHGSSASLPAWNRGTAIQSAPMTAVLFRRSVFETVGGLDEQFGSYLEDVDFGLRCAARGLSGWFEPAAVACHEGSATLGTWSPRMVRLIARNQVLLARKYGFAGGKWPVVAGQLGWGLLALKHGAGFAWIQGKIEGCRLAAPRTEMHSNDFTAIAGILNEQERRLGELLKETGQRDTFWSAYFKVCGGRA